MFENPLVNALSYFITIFVTWFLRGYLDDNFRKQPKFIISTYRIPSTDIANDGTHEIEATYKNVGDNPIKKFKVFYKNLVLFEGQGVEKGRDYTITFKLQIISRSNDPKIILEQENLNYPLKIVYCDFHKNHFYSDYFIKFGHLGETNIPEQGVISGRLHFWQKSI